MKFVSNINAQGELFCCLSSALAEAHDGRDEHQAESHGDAMRTAMI
jgi:hypothetical protein